mmetsp:Transcript_20637/g.51565  ORF Transcript_20637/g.51565 Transcript_20637/m.51565 type:complete len:241 (-) Transcript_20637:209-931(-)
MPFACIPAIARKSADACIRASSSAHLPPERPARRAARSPPPSTLITRKRVPGDSYTSSSRTMSDESSSTASHAASAARVVDGAVSVSAVQLVSLSDATASPVGPPLRRAACSCQTSIESDVRLPRRRSPEADASRVAERRAVGIAALAALRVCTSDGSSARRISSCRSAIDTREACREKRALRPPILAGAVFEFAWRRRRSASASLLSSMPSWGGEAPFVTALTATRLLFDFTRASLTVP